MTKELIDALGGNKAVAKAINASAGAIANWRLRDTIPWRYRHAIARLAAEQAVALPQDFWTEARSKAA